MYMKDKSHRITLRLNDDQFNYIMRDCDRLGVAPSEYVRMVINMSMSIDEDIKGAVSRENDKANYNDNV